MDLNWSHTVIKCFFCSSLGKPGFCYKDSACSTTPHKYSSLHFSVKYAMKDYQSETMVTFIQDYMDILGDEPGL